MKLATFLLAIAFTLATAASSGADLWTSIFKERMHQARLGAPEAQFEIGAMYENGRGVEIDRAVAADWYRKSAAQGYERATNALARMEDNERRLAKISALAESGDIEAQYSLGNMYLTGTGTLTDLGRAQVWLSRAASKGHIKAQYKLGHLYYVDMAENTDNKAALEWFTKAAASDYGPAQYYLGDMYASGSGVQQDYAKAREWYSKAQASGFTLAAKGIKELDDRIAEEKKRELELAETRRLAEAQQAAAVEESMKRAAARAAAAREEERQDPRGNLLKYLWQSENTPAKYLPSKISNCKSSSDEIVCYTTELARKDLPQERYRVKSILRDFKSNGEFKIVYRELVLQSAAEGKEDTTFEPGNIIRTGWLEPHSLKCKFSKDNRLNCDVEDGSVAVYHGA